MEGWRVASKRLGALPRIRRGAVGRGCGREGSGALPQARAAVISIRLRVPPAAAALGARDELLFVHLAAPAHRAFFGGEYPQAG